MKSPQEMERLIRICYQRATEDPGWAAYSRGYELIYRQGNSLGALSHMIEALGMFMKSGNHEGLDLVEFSIPVIKAKIHFDLALAASNNTARQLSSILDSYVRIREGQQRVNAAWDEIWREEEERRHDAHMRTLRAIGGQCLDCGCPASTKHQSPRWPCPCDCHH